MDQLPSPITLLKQHFSERKSKNIQYSLRAFARDLGISPPQLSRILSGKRDLSYRQMLRVGKALGLPRPQIQEYVQKIIVEGSPRAKVASKLRAKMQKKNSLRGTQPSVRFESPEALGSISQWYYLAILELTFVEGFKSEPAWIASRLKIDEHEARSALEQLENLGLLIRAPNGFLQKASRQLWVTSNRSAPAIRNHEKAMIEKAKKELDKCDPSAFEKRLINSITFPASNGALTELKDAVFDFQNRVLTIIKNHPYHEVYQLNCQLFPLVSDEVKSC